MGVKNGNEKEVWHHNRFPMVSCLLSTKHCWLTNYTLNALDTALVSKARTDPSKTCLHPC